MTKSWANKKFVTIFNADLLGAYILRGNYARDKKNRKKEGAGKSNPEACRKEFFAGVRGAVRTPGSLGRPHENANRQIRLLDAQPGTHLQGQADVFRRNTDGKELRQLPSDAVVLLSRIESNVAGAEEADAGKSLL